MAKKGHIILLHVCKELISVMSQMILIVFMLEPPLLCSYFSGVSAGLPVLLLAEVSTMLSKCLTA